jgi:hypothetical protein
VEDSGYWMLERRFKKEEGRRKKEEGRRKK